VRSRRRGVQAAQQTQAHDRGRGQAEEIASDAAQVAAEEALARREAEQQKAEIRQDLEAVNAYMAKHGSFAEMVRRHYRDD
jgi:hypothetical protein